MLVENDQATVPWDSQIITDRLIHCNKPYTMIKEKEILRYMVIFVVIPSDYNIQTKTTKKMSKYIDLKIECE